MPVITGDSVIHQAANAEADLAAKITGDLAGATIHLFTNNFTPTPDNVLADFTEASYSSYTPVAASGWSTPAYQGNGVWETNTTNVAGFVGPSGGGGPTVYGYFVKSAGTGTPLIYAANFTTPIGLADNTRSLEMVATYNSR